MTPTNTGTEALEGAVPTLSALRDEGVIGAWGAGMNQAGMLRRFVTETDIDVIMLAGRYTLLEQGAATDLLPACLEKDVAVVNVGVFNSGLLSKNRPADGATYNYESAPRELLDRATRLAQVCEAHGTTLPAAALAYPYRHPAVTSVVLGMRTPEQVQQNLELAAQSVPEALWNELRELGLIPVTERLHYTPKSDHGTEKEEPMQFVRIGAPGAETPAVLQDDKYYSLETVAADIDARFWQSGGPARAAAALEAGELPEFSPEWRRGSAPRSPALHPLSASA